MKRRNQPLLDLPCYCCGELGAGVFALMVENKYSNTYLCPLSTESLLLLHEKGRGREQISNVRHLVHICTYVHMYIVPRTSYIVQVRGTSYIVLCTRTRSTGMIYYRVHTRYDIQVSRTITYVLCTMYIVHVHDITGPSNFLEPRYTCVPMYVRITRYYVRAWYEVHTCTQYHRATIVHTSYKYVQVWSKVPLQSTNGTR